MQNRGGSISAKVPIHFQFRWLTSWTCLSFQKWTMAASIRRRQEHGARNQLEESHHYDSRFEFIGWYKHGAWPELIEWDHRCRESRHWLSTKDIDRNWFGLQAEESKFVKNSKQMNDQLRVSLKIDSIVTNSYFLPAAKLYD